jgi:adenylate cyclase class 2
MNEIEVKVLGIDQDKIKEKLEILGAEPVKKEFQVNYMFDFADSRFFSKGGYVRIRHLTDFAKNREKIAVTFKELISREKFKISKEIEFNSDNFSETKNFLEALGLKLFRVDEKFRESYRLAEGLIEIDTWAGVPSYLEVEAETGEKVEILLGRLGLKLEESTSMTLAEILIHYNLSNENRIFSESEKKFLSLQMKANGRI